MLFIFVRIGERFFVGNKLGGLSEFWYGFSYSFVMLFGYVCYLVFLNFNLIIVNIKVVFFNKFIEWL